MSKASRAALRRRVQSNQIRYTPSQESLRYNGAASRRTRAYTNRGNATGMGAAVQNRMASLMQRYGNDPRNAARIMRAGGNIMSRASVYK